MTTFGSLFDNRPAAVFHVVPHPGRVFEDVEVGHSFPCGGFTLGADEIMAFGRAFDPQPFHVDREAAARTLPGSLIASAAHTMAATVGIFTRATSGFDMVIGLGLGPMEFPRSAHPDVPLLVVGTWTEARLSRSRPGTGIVGWRAETRDEAGRLVLGLHSTIVFRARR